MTSPYQPTQGGSSGPMLSPPQGPSFPGLSGGPPQGGQPRDLNTAMMCRIGQETVQEIVSKTIELFQTLKALQPPTGTGLASQEERRLKIQETLRNVGILFKRLRRVYDICNDSCPGMEYAHIEPDVALQSLVPMKDEQEGKTDDRRGSEALRVLLEERTRLTEQVSAKNRHLKEVLDALRNIIWEINTMLAMRKRHLQFTHRISAPNPPLIK
ncbi:mediator of RNA polymerase II transcription subunit 30-like isoform X2 [Ornithodoros turicata]|uniref:mediator of RNA polymerase II transcription subunit 30-like isoform X2 n=1 Tax=Ornithodoros turicata TaxID=34597 RepID=UPI00313868F5